MKKLGRAVAVVAGSVALIGASAAGAYAYSATLTSLEPPGGGTNDPDLTITSTSGLFDISCDSASVAATISSPPSSATPSGTLNSFGTSPCAITILTLPPLPATVTTWGSWGIVPTFGSRGSLTSVTMHVEQPDGLCEFDITGSTGTSYTLASQTLAVTGSTSLVVSNVVGCFGGVLEGDGVALDVDFAVA